MLTSDQQNKNLNDIRLAIAFQDLYYVEITTKVHKDMATRLFSEV
jgi:hypothetical protein